MNAAKLIIVLASLISLSFSAHASDQDEDHDDAMAKCLKAWGTNPFGNKPEYKTLSTSVKVFGIGTNPKDTTVTSTPKLILVNPGVNVMGGTTFELMNPNGWYCFKANVNVMGGLTIKAHCKAHLASSGDGATVLGSSETEHGNGVTVMGSTHVELVGCDKKSKE
jgi:hypothetical protein